MKKSRLLGAVCAVLFTVITLSANAAFIGVLPATPGGTDWQAYYDDQQDITWTANADINGTGTWDDQVAWAAGLTIDGIGDWRLPNMDINGDGTIVDCSSDTQAACMDNEYGHLYYYGAGTTSGSGITRRSPGPFSNVQSRDYWSGTEFALDPNSAWFFRFIRGSQELEEKINTKPYAWAVYDGDVREMSVPPAVWLFGSGLLGLVGIARKNV